MLPILSLLATNQHISKGQPAQLHFRTPGNAPEKQVRTSYSIRWIPKGIFLLVNIKQNEADKWDTLPMHTLHCLTHICPMGNGRHPNYPIKAVQSPQRTTDSSHTRQELNLHSLCVGSSSCQIKELLVCEIDFRPLLVGFLV